MGLWSSKAQPNGAASRLLLREVVAATHSEAINSYFKNSMSAKYNISLRNLAKSGIIPGELPAHRIFNFSLFNII